MHKTDTHRNQMTTEAKDGENPGVGNEFKSNQQVSRVNDVNVDFDQDQNQRDNNPLQIREEGIAPEQVDLQAKAGPNQME